ncbi:MAG: single-stranded-DNA-specific exonuclease RecJ [Spirochaetaceae bacterium]|jgi:single-stranded-DNA-specific exonuclease|nr:single-stranded-DNA-specific exonuclease RecJ [Spirochaetaceae bacterium]
MVWEKRDIPQDAVKELAAQFGCDPLTASILLRRGVVKGEDVLYYLEDDKRYLHNPFLLPGMEDAVERILAAKEEGEKVLVFGDRDVDGITSTTLLTSYLRGMGLEVGWRIPQGDEAYGLSAVAVEEAARDSVTLIVTVDCGISNFAEVDQANDLGIDVVITDHHNPQETVPDAVAIVNPKLEGSAYPFREICGCVVAYKLVSALRFALHAKSYGAALCLLNVRPSNDAVVIEVAKMRNLAVVKTLSETIVPGTVSVTETRLPDFLSGHQILVWDAGPQQKLLAGAFGKSVDFNLFDAAPEIAKEIPGVAGKSLLRLREGSRLARYAEKPLSELDVFCNLFVSYMRKRDNLAGGNDDELLQLAALGTVADIMPLENENRVIVRAGVKSLNAGARSGVSNLMAKLDLAGNMLSMHDISWKLSPALNAAGRMGQAEKAVGLLLSEDRAEREQLAAEIVLLNEERKRIGDEGWKVALPLAEEGKARYHDAFVVAASAEIPRGVTGIIANRLMKRFNVPAMVVNVTGETAVGSLRSTRGYALAAFLETCADLFVDRGGHDYAAGFTLNMANWPAFLERVERLSASIELDGPDEGADDVITIDAELPPSYLKPDIFKIVDRFEPFGNENPDLVFLSRGLTLTDLAFMGKLEANHVKFTLDAGAHKWPCVYWQAADKAGREFSDGDRVDAVFNIARDYFGGKERHQLVIIDVQRAGIR